MRTPAKHIVELGDALRRHALDCGADMNAANLFVHAVLMRALAANADLAHVAASEEVFHARNWDIRGETRAAGRA